jgi:hypothetical protein
MPTRQAATVSALPAPSAGDRTPATWTRSGFLINERDDRPVGGILSTKNETFGCPAAWLRGYRPRTVAEWCSGASAGVVNGRARPLG